MSKRGDAILTDGCVCNHYVDWTVRGVIGGACERGTVLMLDWFICVE